MNVDVLYIVIVYPRINDQSFRSSNNLTMSGKRDSTAYHQHEPMCSTRPSNTMSFRYRVAGSWMRSYVVASTKAIPDARQSSSGRDTPRGRCPQAEIGRRHESPQCASAALNVMNFAGQSSSQRRSLLYIVIVWPRTSMCRALSSNNLTMSGFDRYIADLLDSPFEHRYVVPRVAGNPCGEAISGH